MKKILTVFLVVFVMSIPAQAILPEFGIKGGVNIQNFGDMEVAVIPADFGVYSDSLSTLWPAAELFADVNLPILPFGLRGEVGYAWKSEGGSRATDLYFAVSGKIIISPPLSPLGFYLGVGPSLHILSWENESENIYGALVYAGANLKLGLNVFGEVGYGYMFPSEGSWSQINVKFGMYF